MDVDDVKELNCGYTNIHKKAERKRGASYIWNEFIQQSTLHGLHYLFEKRPAIQRFFWLILQGLMSVLFLWQTLTLALDYLEYNVTSTIEFVTEKESNFPAVTLCNFNMYRNSVLYNTYPDFHKVLLEQFPLYKEGAKPVNWTKYDAVNNLNMENLIREAGHQMQYDNVTKKGMLYHCTWRGDPCEYTDFKEALTDMGLCYTFNAAGKNTSNRKVDGPGKLFGLHLKMSVEQNEYVGNVAFSAGLRIRIHDPDEPPLVSSLGFAVMPGSHVFASITRQRTVSLPHPYKTMCKDKKLSGIKAYTIAACHDHCKKEYIAKECGCNPFYVTDTSNRRRCNAEKYFNCVHKLGENFSSSSTRNCECTEPCDTMKYSAYLSYGTFPGMEAARAYANHHESAKDKDKDKIIKGFQEDLLAIDVFFEDLNYHVIKQVPSYSLQNLLGEIGGLMGLFLGASILTVFEFIDVFVMIILIRLGIRRQL